MTFLEPSDPGFVLLSSLRLGGDRVGEGDMGSLRRPPIIARRDFRGRGGAASDGAGAFRWLLRVSWGGGGGGGSWKWSLSWKGKSASELIREDGEAVEATATDPFPFCFVSVHSSSYLTWLVERDGARLKKRVQLEASPLGLFLAKRLLWLSALLLL